MSLAEKPVLLYFDLQERNDGETFALIAHTCEMIKCGYPLGRITDRGLILSGKHGQVHTSPLVPADLRRLADFVESLQANGDTMAEDKAA